jgi:NADH:ubiquinone oxidoreductase subunit 6 (subunit J)
VGERKKNMTIHTILFNLYASLALATGIGVITSKNPVHSVIFLILVFCNATGLLLLFKIELLAMMFIIIYVGAIAVLFLFVVMMLNIKRNELGLDDLTGGNTKRFDMVTMVKTPIIMSGLILVLTLLLVIVSTKNDFLLNTQ